MLPARFLKIEFASYAGGVAPGELECVLNIFTCLYVTNLKVAVSIIYHSGLIVSKH